MTILLSESLLKCVVEWEELSSRLMWVRVKIQRKNWAFISVYRPGINSQGIEEEIEEFWSELSECVGSFGRNGSVVVPGNLSASVGNEVIDRIVR